mgnify:CR=1 FL=1
MASIKDNMEQLEELFRQDGGGYLLIGYETGMDKPMPRFPTSFTLSIRIRTA